MVISIAFHAIIVGSIPTDICPARDYLPLNFSPIIKILSQEDIKLGYDLGQRDMLASILAEAKDEIRYPQLARQYEKGFGEKHFSHEWHTSGV